MIKISVCSIIKETLACTKEFLDYLIDTFSSSVFEIIVVDNGLDNDARKLLDNYPIRVIKGDKGAFDSTRELYLKKALGEYILIIDADERITSEGLAILLNTVQRDFPSHVLGFCLPILTYTGNGRWAQFRAVRLLKNGQGIRYDGKEMHSTLLTKNGEALIEYCEYIYVPIHHYDCLIKGKSYRKRIRNIEKLKQIVSENPKDAISIMFLGLEHMAFKDYNSANKCFLDALELRPQSDYVKYFYMLLQYYIGNTEQSLELSLKLRNKGKYTDVCTIIIASIYDKNKRDDIAKKYLLSELENNPLQPAICLSLGALLEEIEPQRAIYFLNQALTLNPMLSDKKIYNLADGPNLYQFQNILINRVKNIYYHLNNAHRVLGNIELARYYKQISDTIENNDEVDFNEIL